MTYNEFLARLLETPRDWIVCFQGEIRRNVHPNQCPLSSVVDLPASRWVEAAMKLSLDAGRAEAILRAADHRQSHSTTMRRELLDACGLPADPV
jgi:hypothetical protein